MVYDLGIIKNQRYTQPSITSYGGNIVTVDSSTGPVYAVHVFTSSGAFTFPSYLTSSTARVFVVGGGGGGGSSNSNSQAAGGGAGGVISSSTYSLTPGYTYAISVGSGGAVAGSGNVSRIVAPTDATYSGSFNGSSQYLTLPTNTALNFSTGDFTIEGWIYRTAAGTDNFIISASGSGGLGFGFTGTGANLGWVRAAVAWDYNVAHGMGLNTWYHVALTRSGTSIRMFVNGTQLGVTQTLATAYDLGVTSTNIGSQGANYYYSGYISNLRVLKGTALYTGNFTPPTNILTAITNTSLLTLQNSTFIDNSVNNITITAVAGPITTNTSTYTPPLGFTAFGGGAGAPGSVSNQVGYNGASGGGGSVWNFSGTISGGYGMPGQGNAGGGSTGAGSGFASGGGGGAFTAGRQGNAGTNIGGAGGTGTFTTFISTAIAVTSAIGQYITATNAVYFGGGGGGGGNTTVNVGGWGGGGNDGWSTAGFAGTSNSGGGGGGGGSSGGSGGSGVVIITYPLPSNTVSVLPTDPYFNYTSLLLTSQTPILYADTVEYLIVAGGGGGSTSYAPGGGGAGGFISSTTSITTQTYTVTIGAGGAAGYPPDPGTNSSFAGFTAVGGGRGGGGANGGPQVGGNGGSGGGGGWFGTTTAGGSGTAGQGFDGGTSNGSGGGGGGASEVGVAGGRGGNGREWPTGSGTYYAGGGSGSGSAVSALGGGGPGSAGAGSAGRANTGGGAGGDQATGGQGGSGVVIIRHLAKNLAAATTGNPTITTKDGYRYYTFTASGTIAWYNSKSFIDSSANNLIITPQGTPAQGSFSPFSPSWSGYFNGTTSYLTTPSTGKFAINTFLGAGKTFTVEAWLYQTSFQTTTGYYSLVLGDASSTSGGLMNWCFGTDTTNKPLVNWFDGATKTATGATALTLNTWNHVAWVVTAGVVKIYVNGISQTLSGTTTLTNSNATTAIVIGVDRGQYYAGYISNLRAVSGTALYTSDFTPTTAPLPVITNTTLLTCASNNFIDKSGTTSTITATGTPSVQRFAPFSQGYDYNTLVQGGSAYFNGSTDYLTAPITAGLTFGSGGTVSPMTAEAWFYTTTTPGTDQTVISQYASGSSGWSIRLLSGVIRAALTGDTTLITGTTSLKSNNWYHVALSGSAGSWKLFLNGVQEGATQTSSVTMGDTAAVVVGRLSTVSYFNGYISNVRVIKGTAIYTSNFTPPLAPVTAIANTSLLLNFTNATIIDYTGKTNPLSVNTATLSTSIVKYNTRSVKFNGVADYLKLPAISDAFVFGTSNFTVEYWVYYNALPASVTVICGNATGAAGLAFGASSTAKLHMFSNTTAYTSTGATLVTGQWYHVAFVRQSGSVKYYLNGALDYTVSVSTSITELTGSVGAKTGGTLYSNCYIDDLRVTKGVARYLSAFTPSSVKTQIK